ncbi:hypothetical protein [Halobacillus sp. A5]|uniref:hypothetical protein n=1 Tax=Halobacillus sp. A5 TaxID=2880263 RepID=UPI0020A63FFF|nr:hypothetical protein [Halobacillus sp. A5]MCP3026631.1 hypothetical protein [Halobacillus sp. A5]
MSDTKQRIDQVTSKGEHMTHRDILFLRFVGFTHERIARMINMSRSVYMNHMSEWKRECEEQGLEVD